MGYKFNKFFKTKKKLIKNLLNSYWDSNLYAIMIIFLFTCEALDNT